MAATQDVRALLDRSHALGADPRVTNYAGGNTSCKAAAIDPVTGDEITILWIKGSGGDLGTLTFDGLAALVLDRVLALKDDYPGPDREDEMVPPLDHCRFGAGGAPPSIDTPLHAFLPPAHVDHVHPDAVIALAASRDGETLTKECFGEAVGWVDWRRPGFELALQMSQLHAQRPGLRGIVLGGHGLFSWGETSQECQRNTLDIIATAERFLAERGRSKPFGDAVAGRVLDRDERVRRAATLAPVIRGLCSTDTRVVGRFTDAPAVLEFLASESASRLASLGTSCPDHFLRTKVKPLLLDGSDATACHDAYRADYRAYYERHASAASPPMRGADPAVVLVPGVGMWSFGRTAHEARVAGMFYENAINVMRGAESVSAYDPISEAEKFGIEYWSLEEAKLRRLPPPKPLSGRVALVVGGASGIGRACARRLANEGTAVVVSDRDERAAEEVAAEMTDAVAVVADVTDETAVARMIDDACLAFGGIDVVVQSAGLSIAKPLADTTVHDWNLQFDVLARGSFLVAREAAKAMSAAGLGGDIIIIVSKNAVVAGPANAAYGAAKAAQAHLVRLLAAELGSHGIRVNGVNPDAVVRGSGIFAGDWGAERARVHGVDREELGAFYAERTLLKQEILPEDVAGAVFALAGGDLGKTTGTIIPVDGGVPAAFLR